MKSNSGMGRTRVLPILLLGCAMMLAACNERTSGCLDIQAENFDFNAESGDPSACVYPNLLLNVFYQWDTTSLQTDHLYADADGQPYVIHAVQILMSRFIVQNADGEDLTVEKHVVITKGDCTGGEEIEVPDDFVLVDRSAINYSLGGFRESGTMQQFRTTIGVPESYTPLCTESLPTTHLLRGSRVGYDPVDGRFALGRFIVRRDSLNAVNDTLFAYGNTSDLTAEVMREFHRGKPDTLYLAIDFAKIFSDVKFNEPDSVVAQTIASGISGALTLH